MRGAFKGSACQCRPRPQPPPGLCDRPPEHGSPGLGTRVWGCSLALVRGAPRQLCRCSRSVTVTRGCGPACAPSLPSCPCPSGLFCVSFWVGQPVLRAVAPGVSAPLTGRPRRSPLSWRVFRANPAGGLGPLSGRATGDGLPRADRGAGPRSGSARTLLWGPLPGEPPSRLRRRGHRPLSGRVTHRGSSLWA